MKDTYKNRQELYNVVAIQACNDCKYLIHNEALKGNSLNKKRLYNCNAQIFSVSPVWPICKEHFIILESWNTVIACIADGVLYDFLLYVYPKTPAGKYPVSSRQQINKFKKKFASLIFDEVHYLPVKR